MATGTEAPPPTTSRALHIGNRAAHRAALRSTTTTTTTPPRPVLVHLNGDTSWLLQLPYPADPSPPSPGRGRRRRRWFNILLDPWFRGPQSDVAAWFSTQWHVVPASVGSVGELEGVLRGAEGGADCDDKCDDDSNSTDGTGTQAREEGNREEAGGEGESYIDALAISHEFTDHCHEATLREVSPRVPVFATEKAAQLVRGWGHFDTVITTPAFDAAGDDDDDDDGDWRSALSVAPLPEWLGIGRVVSAGNALYYHSALIIAFTSPSSSLSNPSSSSPSSECILYSPHGISPSSLLPLSRAPNLSALALLHGLHDVRIWATKQLNLGGLNGARAARACGARYWVATHDEVKKGGGVLAPLLRRTRWSVADAVRREAKGLSEEGAEKEDAFAFVELGSGDGVVLA
ncbi:hypothetical protein F4780DRAFT_293789 [Xylariomycetidae sp. FL0641]|nr:hypothetical protein F4780DRAFT_293789 [Xylariomycetidae sp. FL0641]